MKRSLVLLLMAIVVALALVLGYFYVQAPPATPVRQGQTAPELELVSKHGRLRLSSLGHLPVMLVVFDTRWPLSRVYLAEIERLHRLYGPVGLAVVGVGIDTDPDAVTAFVRPAEISFLIYSDPGGRVIGPRFGLPHGETPLVYLIAPGGRVEGVYADLRRWREGGMREKLKELIRPFEAAAPR
jgi:peroxiredoxin